MGITKTGLRWQSDFDDRLPNIFSVTPTNGQTVFLLPEEPLVDNLVFEVNTVSYHSPDFFTITAPNNMTITWLDNLFTLDTGDSVRIIYYPAN